MTITCAETSCPSLLKRTGLDRQLILSFHLLFSFVLLSPSQSHCFPSLLSEQEWMLLDARWERELFVHSGTLFLESFSQGCLWETEIIWRNAKRKARQSERLQAEHKSDVGKVKLEVELVRRSRTSWTSAGYIYLQEVNCSTEIKHY